ncbi:MAG TPA: hypothetical protein VEJ38_12475 [Candidatus Acidoferrales bacterium]|nr:hypothetical protein [Candidatus Acidoferrales bacterium]
MNVAAAPPLGEFRRCQLCKQMRATTSVTFHRNVGMLVTRRGFSVTGKLCRSCIHRKFWEFQGKNLLLGPWGFFSLMLTPILLVMNTGTYLTALYKLRDAIE